MSTDAEDDYTSTATPAKLRGLIMRTYEVGQHNGRPVAVPNTGGEPIYLDTSHGLNAWRYDLLHKKRFGETATGLDRGELQEMVEAETTNQRIEAKEHGHEVGGIDPERAAVIDLAEDRNWAVGVVQDDYVVTARKRAVSGLVEERESARAMAKAAEGFAWTNLADDWDDEPLRPALLARTDGWCGLYPAQRNLVVGYTESGKTWMELFCLAQEIRAGRPVVLLDHENARGGDPVEAEDPGPDP